MSLAIALLALACALGLIGYEIRRAVLVEDEPEPSVEELTAQELDQLLTARRRRA